MPTQYTMRATQISTSKTVYWVVTGAPDNTGAQSGINPSDLTGIATDYTSNVTAASTGGSVVSQRSWRTVYDVDFSSLPTQSFSGNGSVSINGKTWTVANFSSASSMGITNGTGLTIACNTTFSDYNNSTRNGPLVTVPIKTLYPNFDIYSNKVRISLYTTHNADQNFEFSLFGFEDADSPMTLSNVLFKGYQNGAQFAAKQTFNSSSATTLDATNTSDNVLQVTFISPYVAEYRSAVYSNGFPDQENYRNRRIFLTSGNWNSSISGSTDLNIVFGAVTNNTNGNFTTTAIRLKLEVFDESAAASIGSISDAYASLPSSGVAGRLFFPNDRAGQIYRDSGYSWQSALDPLPTYAALDSDTLLCWRFQESTAPFPNLGTQASEDMTAESGEGTVWAGGQPDGSFGKGLKFSMSSTGSGGIRATHFTYPTSNITVSMWITPTRTLGASSIGRAFFNSYYPSSWSSPFIGIEMGYFNSTNGFSATVYTSLGYYSATLHNDFKGVQLYKRHHIGFTYGDGNLKLYLNGYLGSTTVGTGALDLGTGPWCIGRTVSTSLNEHCGMILHEVRIDKAVKSADWFLQAWKNGKSI